MEYKHIDYYSHRIKTSMLYHLLSLSNETTTSPSSSPSSSSSRDSYVVGGIVGGILGLLVLVGIGLIAHFRCIVLPQTQTQKDKEIRNHSGTWDDDEEEFDSFRPSLIISTWVGRIVSNRYSISRQPIKSDMEVYTPDNNNDDTEQPSSSVINQRSGSIFQTSSSSESIRPDSTGHNNNSSHKSIQESVSVRESGQSSRDSNSNSKNKNNNSSSSSSSSGGGLSVLRTSPLGRSPVVLARSIDSSRRCANTGAPSSSSPIKDCNTRGTRWQATQLVAVTGHRVRLLPTLDSPQIDLLFPTQSPEFIATREREYDGALWGHLECSHLSARGLQYPGLEPGKHAWCLLRSSTGAIFWEQCFGVVGDGELNISTISSTTTMVMTTSNEVSNVIHQNLTANTSNA